MSPDAASATAASSPAIATAAVRSALKNVTSPVVSIGSRFPRSERPGIRANVPRLDQAGLTTRNATVRVATRRQSGQRHLPAQKRPWVDQAAAWIGGRLRVSVDGPRHFVMHLGEAFCTGSPEHPD